VREELQCIRECVGITCRTTTLVRVPIVGTKTAGWHLRSATDNLFCRWRCWNERDPILKERLFGLTGNEGNHSEDVKECYFYLDSTPTHSYMKYLYKYPQAEFSLRAFGDGKPATR